MEVNDHLLEKYYTGKCSIAEKRAVEQWMSEGIPFDQYTLRPHKKEDDLKNELWSRIQLENKETDPIVSKIDYSPRPFYWGRYAAAILLLCTITIAGWYIYDHPIGDIQDENQSVANQETIVPLGKQAEIILSDGTKVRLNAGSVLRYPKQFNNAERRVFLQGEGFFDVAKDEKKPFYVETVQTIARVVGTQFNLLADESGNHTLTVEEGKVQFSANGCPDTLLLTANRQGEYDGKQMHQSTVHAHKISAWTRGVLLFDDTPLSEAASKIAHWFDVAVVLEQPRLASYRINASFKDATLKEVLHEVAFALNIQYKLKDKEVVLYK